MGHLPPGSRLSVPALAREFGVSRSPIRDAVLHLVRDGLGEETLNRGAIVRTFSPAHLLSLYEGMEALEGMAARLAADRSDAAVHKRLTDMVREHHHDIAGTGSRWPVDAADAFHGEIWAAAASPVLARMLEDLQGQVRLAMCSASLGGGNAHAIEDHRELLDAIAAGDADASEAAARRHVVRLRAMLWDVV